MKKLLKRLIHTILMLLLPLISGMFTAVEFPGVHAQKPLRIRGMVFNEDTYKPLPFASVSLKNKPRGTVTNAEGRFILMLDSASRDDSLVFSFVGFREKTRSLQKALAEQNMIYLKPQPFVLEEVVVRSSRARKVLIKSLATIAQNYPEKGMRMDAFYRAIVKDNDVPVQFSEAQFDIYKSPYEQIWRQDRIKLIKGRNKKDLPNSPIWNYVKFINGPLELLYSDIARHPKSFIQVPQHRVNFLKERHFKHYRYQLIKTINKNGKNLFVIDFIPTSRRAVFSGKIFIDQETHAFAGLYYTIDPGRINQAQIVPYETKNHLYEEGIEIRPTDYQCFVDFREIDGTWYFNYAHMNYSFMFIGKRQRILSHINTSTDLAITRIHPENNEKVRGRLMHWEQSLKEMIDASDESFWEGENHIQLEKFRKKELNFMQSPDSSRVK